MRLKRVALAAIAVAAVACVAITPVAAHPRISTLRETQSGTVSGLAGSVTALGGSYLSTKASALVPSQTAALTASVQAAIDASGGTAAVTLIELGRTTPVIWSLNGSTVFIAASTYKLAALMMEAQSIAAGKTDPNGYVCYQDDDYESGWFDDYVDGACFTRNELALRAGIYSDNTAGHMLVRDLGGAEALNAWAAANGATQSVFFTDNTSTSDDLAALWVAEATGRLGGSAAQSWLYPLLIDTRTESGIPAGVGSGTTVVHKTGTIDDIVDDAALVEHGPHGAYVVTVMTSGLGDAGWQLISSISSDVWTFEESR